MALQTMYPPQNNGIRTQISAVINAAATSITVEDASVLPAPPNVLSIGGGDDTELVKLVSVTGNILTVERGFNGTTAKAWDAETKIYRGIQAQDVSALQANVNTVNGKADAHASRHGTGGDDALTPAAIGAAASADFSAHASRHASSGADALAPADIGAEAVRLQFTGISVPAGAFVDYTAEAGSEEAALFAMGYEKRASVALTGVLASMTPSVTFSLPSVDAAGIGIANQFACYTGGIYVYADGVPESAITALTIECRKAVA